MKIAIINNLYKPFQRGGAEKVAELMSKQARDMGWEVVLVASKPNRGESVENNFEKIYWINSGYFNLYKIPKIFRLFWHFWDLFDFVTADKIKKILESESPDLIVTHNLTGISRFLPIAIRKLSYKHIHILHDIQLLHLSGLLMWEEENIIDNLFSRYYQKICSWLFKDVKIVVSPSEWLLNLHSSHGLFRNAQQKKVIANPSDSTDNKLTQKATSQNNIFRFLYVGQIEKHKGVDWLLDTIITTQGKINGRSFTLEIVGGGSLLENIKVKSQGLPYVRIAGRLDNSTVKKIMLDADALIVPSFCYENSPTVIFEAIRSCLPVIATNIGGTPEIIHKYDCGQLFEPGNVSSLILAMSSTIGHLEEIRKKTSHAFEKITTEKNDYISKLVELGNIKSN